MGVYTLSIAYKLGNQQIKYIILNFIPDVKILSTGSLILTKL
jgi:hypothetical protein